MNQIEGQISPFTLSGWLRHGCEEVVQVAGASACHPGEPDADYMRSETYERDLDSGYHKKGACLDEHDAGCVVYDLFGGFGPQAGKLLRRPVSFSPIRRNVDVLDGEAEAHFRQVSNQVRSRNDEDGGSEGDGGDSDGDGGEYTKEDMGELVTDEIEERPDDLPDDVPSKATITIKEINDNRYYYWQWREGEKIKSKYKSPVNPDE